MRLSISLAAAAALASSTLVAAQTYTNCDPRDSSDCPPDPALGKAATYDLTKGAPSGWTASGTIDYSSKGGAFTVAKEGDSPLITSDFYIMWGHVEYVLQAAPGTGIVSSAVMQSDTLDEIDWEFLGGDSTTVQTNYFGHGDTAEYDREQTFSTPNNQAGFHTYAVDWTADRIVWQIDGTTVRTLTPATADSGQYPQTPMMIKIGIWAGGDPSNPPGTISWAGGVTDYSQGPFTMYCQSISVTDYSTGSEYKYTSESGTADSISAVGGSVGGNMGATASVATEAASPTVTSSNGEEPIPWSGTHRETSSFVTPSVWPWVSTATASLTSSDPSGLSASAGSTSAPPTVASTSPPTVSSSPSPSASSSLSGGETTAHSSAEPSSASPTTASSTSLSIRIPPLSPVQSTFVTSTPSTSPATTQSNPTSGFDGATTSSTTSSSHTSTTTTTPPAPSLDSAGSQLTVRMGAVLLGFGSLMVLL